LRDELRKRFRSEYLDQLSRRNKNSSTLIKEGDIVLLGHDNLKRLKLVISLGDQDIPKKRWYCTSQSKDCIWRIGAACSSLQLLEICMNTVRTNSKEEQSMDTTKQNKNME